MKNQPAIAAYNSGFARGDHLLRLHLNESPYGAPADILGRAERELAQHSRLYPDSDCDGLRQRLADHIGGSSDMVAVGNGVDELILITTLSHAGASGAVVFTDATFPGYVSAAAAVGAAARPVRLRDNRVCPASLIAEIEAGPELAFVCNPHNPTGTLLGRPDVERIIAAAEASGTIPVFDEAYMDYVEGEHASAIPFARAGRRVIVLRTFSKAWGLAAIRIGYAIGPAELIERTWRFRQAVPFSVNRIAQRVIPALLDNAGYLDEVPQRTATARALLCRRLSMMRVRFVPSVTNFVMILVDADSTKLTAGLAERHGILVRDLAAFGLPGCIRVSVGTSPEIERFCSALAAELSDRGSRFLATPYL